MDTMCQGCQREHSVKINPGPALQNNTKTRQHLTNQTTQHPKKFIRLSRSTTLLLLIATVTILLPTPAVTHLLRVPLHHARGRAVSEAVLERRGNYDDTEPGSGDVPLPSRRQNLGGLPGEGYYLEMRVGTPPSTFNVLVDTGSSNFALAAAPNQYISTYFNTSDSETYKDIGTSVSVPYTQGNWEGVLGRDLVTLSSLDNVTIEVNIAFITESEDFFIPGANWQGILGLAYAEIARPDEYVEPFLDTLERRTGMNHTFSLQLCGSTDVLTDSSMNGSLVFGGVDHSLYDGELHYVPMYKQWYYEIIITDISVNGKSLGLDCKEYNFDKTIVDSGTTNLRLPHRTFTTLVKTIQSKTIATDQPVPDLFWSGDDLLCWAEGDTPWYAFPSVEISLAAGPDSSVTMVISPQQYLRAVTEDEVQTLGLFRENCYKFAISPSDTGTVLGAVVMEGYYVVFDRENGQVGFAKSTCRNRDPTTVQPAILGPKTHNNTVDCAYHKPPSHQSALLLAAYVMAGICGICLLPLLYIAVQWQVRKCRRRQRDDNQTETATSDIRGLLNEEDDVGVGDR